MAQIDSPIPVSDIESVLTWVDTFKLSRPHKKINRDFSDAVLLAEILNYNYPKLVDMHNYPPRNSHSLKLNNWMTLNRKVLKKLKLSLCCNTMEQLANSAPGVIERVLVMVREKIRRDEDANKSLRDAEQNLSSGGSYYEACGDEDHVLVIPLKTRVNGVLETIQQKVVSYDGYCNLKEQLKDAKEAAEVLKQKVEHLDNLLSLKQIRIDELQNQLERKQARRKEAEVTANTLAVPFENPPSPKIANEVLIVKAPSKNIDIKVTEEIVKSASYAGLTKTESRNKIEESKIPVAKESFRTISKPSLTEYNYESEIEVDIIRSNVFETEEKRSVYHDFEDLNEHLQDNNVNNIVTIEATIQREIKDINSKASGQDIKTIRDAAFEYVAV